MSASSFQAEKATHLTKIIQYWSGLPAHRAERHYAISTVIFPMNPQQTGLK